MALAYPGKAYVGISFYNYTPMVMCSMLLGIGSDHSGVLPRNNSGNSLICSEKVGANDENNHQNFHCGHVTARSVVRFGSDR
jgi:hypothetical protein